MSTSLFTRHFTPRELKAVEQTSPQDLTPEINLIQVYIGRFIGEAPARDAPGDLQVLFLNTVTAAMDHYAVLVRLYMQADTLKADFRAQVEAGTQLARAKLGILDWEHMPPNPDPLPFPLDIDDDFVPVEFSPPGTCPSPGDRLPESPN